MVRPVTIHEKPIFVPYVCIQCGLGGPPRDWFVDLGFAIDHYFQADNAAVYLCNECYFNITDSVGRLLYQFRQDHIKWSGEESVAPSYAWEESGNVGRESTEPDTVPPGYAEIPTGTDTGTDGNDQDTESDDSEPESPDSGDADSADDSSTDDTDEGDERIGESSPLSLVKENFPDNWEEPAVQEQDDDVLDPIEFPEFEDIKEFTTDPMEQPEIIGDTSGNNPFDN